jgi:hypothetical protein
MRILSYTSAIHIGPIKYWSIDLDITVNPEMFVAILFLILEKSRL